MGGGDEFIILMPKTGADEAEIIIKRIKEQYSNEYINDLSLSISFGYNTKSSSREDILKVIKGAEDDMYKHKFIENKGVRGEIFNPTLLATRE